MYGYISKVPVLASRGTTQIGARSVEELYVIFPAKFRQQEGKSYVYILPGILACRRDESVEILQVHAWYISTYSSLLQACTVFEDPTLPLNPY